MRNQEREIYIPHPPLFCKTDAADIVVIYQVRRQKRSGYGESGDHASFVCPDVFLLDEVKASADENCSGEIQRSVQDRQIGNCHESLLTSSERRFKSSSSVPP